MKKADLTKKYEELWSEKLGPLCTDIMSAAEEWVMNIVRESGYSVSHEAMLRMFYEVIIDVCMGLQKSARDAVIELIKEVGKEPDDDCRYVM